MVTDAGSVSIDPCRSPHQSTGAMCPTSGLCQVPSWALTRSRCGKMIVPLDQRETKRGVATSDRDATTDCSPFRSQGERVVGRRLNAATRTSRAAPVAAIPRSAVPRPLGVAAARGRLEGALRGPRFSSHVPAPVPDHRGSPRRCPDSIHAPQYFHPRSGHDPCIVVDRTEVER